MTTQAIPTLAALDARGKTVTVIVRADLNVPMQDGRITDATRIERFAPTVRLLAGQGARVVILSHFGRPKGLRDKAFSLRPLVPLLEKACGQPVFFCEDCVGPLAETAARGLSPGEVLLCENLRFHAEEEKNDPAFAAALARLGDTYVNDAFSCAHRAHASTEGIARLLPSYAGLLMAAELSALDAALETPKRPVVAIVGGAKISTKIDLLNNLVEKIDTLALGGGMANTFLAAAGHTVGRSLCEHDMLDQARAITRRAEKAGCRLLLPVDGVAAKNFGSNVPHRTVLIKDLAEDEMILDIGPAAVAEIVAAMGAAKTLLWNGPVGAFEHPPFDAATVALARAVSADCRSGRLTAVAGGGDTVAALAHAGVVEDLSYVSTAGGAFLEWLEGKTLPGVAALKNNHP